MDCLHEVSNDDVTGLMEAQKSYGDSWRKRGGVGAFMMLARKWDRIEERVRQELDGQDRYDIFKHIMADGRAEGLIDDVRDLRRYLLLVEAHLRTLGVKSACSQHR